MHLIDQYQHLCHITLIRRKTLEFAIWIYSVI